MWGGSPPAWNLPPERNKAEEIELNSGSVDCSITKGVGGNGSTSGKQVALKDLICTLVKQKSFSKPRLFLSYITIAERIFDSEYLVV